MFDLFCSRFFKYFVFLLWLICFFSLGFVLDCLWSNKKFQVNPIRSMAKALFGLLFF